MKKEQIKLLNRRNKTEKDCQCDPKGNNQIEEAKNIIRTFISSKVDDIEFKIIEKNNDRDTIEFSIVKGKISITGSSVIALCYGFYSLSKKMKWGMIDWESHSIEIPEKYEDLEKTVINTPYKKHYFLNPVTHGYSTPYWGYEEWEYRIKWMAMHGYDMILTPMAYEAIYARTLSSLGVDAIYLRDYFTGPSFLPWCRLGNISGWNKNPFFEEFNEKQIELQHKIQSLTDRIGMERIVQAFSGFVPKQITMVPGFENTKVSETKWGTFDAYGNYFLNPLEKEFSKIGSLFIAEYEKEFGKQKHYISDSFCEMEIPVPEDAPEELKQEKTKEIINKTAYGLSKMIHDVNPDASWVLTGWMLGYQRWIWNLDTWQAFIDGLVDKTKFILVDSAEDYNEAFWNNGSNWGHFKGFGVNWIYSTIPNMGGNQGYTGPLQWYAKAGPDALKSQYTESLLGYGVSPEGLESNPVTYELLADMGWRNTDMPFDEWIENYTFNRYKFFNEDIKKYWDLRINSINQHLDDHPIYAFQTQPGKTFGRPSTRAMPGWKDAIEQFIKVAKAMDEKDMTDLFKEDLYRMGSLYIGMQIDELYSLLPTLLGKKQVKEAIDTRDKIAQYYDSMDQILASHRLDTISNWIDWARSWGDSDYKSDYYEMDAKKIVTTWMPGVEDYAAKIWHGLIKEYYKPRMLKHIDNMIDPNKSEWGWIDEEEWHFNKISEYSKPLQNPIKDALELIDEAIENRQAISKIETTGSFASIDFPRNTLHKDIKLPIAAKDLKRVKQLTLKLSNRGDYDSQVLINNMHMVGDGKVVYAQWWKEKPLLLNAGEEVIIPIKMEEEPNANNESYIGANISSKGDLEAKFIIEVIVN